MMDRSGPSARESGGGAVEGTHGSGGGRVSIVDVGGGRGVGGGIWCGRSRV